jgi:aminoglycoside 6'-N-acetyltransferase I
MRGEATALVEPCASVDHPGWLEMRQALWPQDSADAHRREMAAYLAQPERYGQFVARTAAGVPAGFAEAAIRHDYVNGTGSSPVGFLEGIYVAPSARRQGVARALVSAVELWARAAGCRELASDAQLDNEPSHATHRALGFEETERVVYFRRRLHAAPAAKVLPRRGATIRDVDAGPLAAVYNHYVLETIATFEEEPVADREMWRRVEAVRALSLPWLVAEAAGGVAGYAYAGPWKARVGYRFTVEISAYLAPGAGGQGLGSALYGQLFEQLEARGIRCVIAGIALPNGASVALHEKFGMRKVAHFARNGMKFGRWIDVGYWQRLMTGNGKE